MSANDPIALTEAETFMSFDIATMQYIYGANDSFASGDDTYTFNDFDGKLMTLWDGGGHDTIDMSGASFGVAVDLREGSLSSIDPWGFKNLSIAYDTEIEDAVGSAYSDVITGNSLANTLTGGSGSDTFVFGLDWGQDEITDFEQGQDKLDFSGTDLTFADFEITSSRDGTLIANGDDSVLLQNAADISESDFMFA